MSNKYIITALMAGLSLTAMGAAPQFKVPARGGDPVKKMREQGVTRKVSQAKSPSLRISEKKEGPKRVVTAYGDAISDVEKYGSLRLLLEEDFSKLTTGTETEPDWDTELTIDPESPDYTYPWWNFKPEFTHQEHWGTGGAYSAGGSLYFHCEEDQAHVNTPLVDASADGAIGVLEFRARAFYPGTTYDYLVIEAADTRNMGPTWDMIDDSVMFSGIPAEWTTYRVVLRGCGPTSIFNIVGVGPGYMLIDDVRVYQLVPKVGMPEVKPHSDYQGTSFTANWSAVEGADKYLLNVYFYNEATRAYEYLVRNREVPGTETSSLVEDTESGMTYWYNVVAVKGDDVSLPSFDWRVYDLEAPVLNPSELIGTHGYKASWNDVPGADVYNYYAYALREAEEDGTFVITDEDFTGILDADGYPTGLTKEDPEQYTYSDYYSNELHQQGWHGTNCCPYDDYIALDAYHYEMSGSLSGFMSPEMDFSKNGGKFTVDVDLAANTTTLWDEDDNEVYYTTQACAALFDYDEELGDYVQTEIFETWNTDPVTEDWKHYTFNFTKGGPNSIVGIFAVTSLDNLYLDNLKITQEYKKGEKLLDPFRYKRFHGFREGEIPNELEMEVPWWSSGCEVYHKVSAFSRQADEYHQSYDDRESPYCEMEFVRTTEKISGVESVSDAAEGTVTRVADQLLVSNPAGEMVNVYTVAGELIHSSDSESVVVKLPARGVYIVTLGARSSKIIY